MAKTSHCPNCGAAISADAPGGLCLRCLAQLGAATPEPARETLVVPFTGSEKPGDHIGNYKLLEQIGEGGCGVVYVAEQEEPIRRRVALKVIKLGMDTRQVIARFEAERQALALMDHPNIAKVLDAGATEAGRPYFVMELVKGIPITLYCDENRLDTQKRLGLFIQVCQAVQHAHQKGIIHRDIKPSNVLVADHDGVPVPKIIDFGIAKATTDQRLTDKTLYTAMEQFIGTPAYMSPEQARLSGLDLDTRSDIYSLGVLLYELLTGRTPFDPGRLVQAGLDEIRRIIREEDPPRPSARLSTLSADEQTTVARQRHSELPKLLGVIRGDLDWIVMKTLEKDRNRRYETANGLALDIERHLRSEPVTARPASQLYRLRRLVRRNKLAFAAAGAVTASLVIGLTVSTSLFFKEKEARRAQIQLRQQAQNEAQRAKAAELDAKNTLSGSDFLQAVHLISEDNAREALADLQGSLLANPTNDAAVVRLSTLLTYRSWMETSEVFKHSGPAQSVQFSPDCTRLLTLSEDNSVRVWDAKTDQPLTAPMSHDRKVRSTQFSPDGKKILTISGENSVKIWDTETGRPFPEFPTNSSRILLAQFSPNGERVATVWQDKTARVWNVETGKAMTEPLKADVATDLLTQDTVTFSPDGERLLTISDEPHGALVGYTNGTNGPEFFDYKHRGTSGTQARVWGVRTGLELTIPLGSGRFVTSGRFSPNAERLVTISFGTNEAHLWVLESMAVNKFPVNPTGLHLVGGNDSGTPMVSRKVEEVSTARQSPDGSQIVVEPGGYSVEKNSKEAPMRPGDAALSHSGQVLSVRFSPDGSKLVTASEDKTARVWDADTGRPIGEPMRHHDAVYLAEFSPDGQRIVTAAGDHTVRVWDAKMGEPLIEPIILSENAVSAQFTPEGRLAVISPQDTLRTWSEHLPQAECLTQRDGVRAAGFSANGKRIVTLSWNNRALVWDTESGQPLTDSLEYPERVCSIQLSPDGTRILTALSNKTARLDSALTGKPLTEPLRHGDVVQSARFSRDGSKLVTASWDNTARVWDAQSGRPFTQPLQHSARVMSAEFNSDGTRIVTVCSDNTARIWDAVSGQPVTELMKHKGRIRSALFNPDGTLIVTASEDGTARVWDARTGQPRPDAMIHAGKVTAAQFSPDGKRIITASEENAVRLWDAQSGKLLRGPLWCGGTIGSVEFSSDSKRFLTASEGAGARVWDAQSGQLLTDLFRHDEGMSYAQFSPDARRILVAPFDIFENRFGVRAARPNLQLEGRVHSVARIYDIAPMKGMRPIWVLKISEAICSQRLNEQGFLEPPTSNPAETFKELREQLSRSDSNDDWTLWGRWFLADPLTRTVSPFFKVPVSEYIENLIMQNTAESLAEADELAFGNAELKQKVAEARKNLSPTK